MLVALITVLGILCAATPALATSLTANDVVVERDGNGVSGLSTSAGSVFLDEFEPLGGHVTALALPTATSGSNKPLLDSGTAGSDGGLTLSSNGACLVTVGYDAPLGTLHITESPVKTYPRTVAVVNGKGEINTTTALTNFANENNARSATSNECTKIWVGGNGTKTTGGVVEAKVGETTGTQLSETVTNIRQVEAVDGQLYASADPEKGSKLSIATVGSGLPEAKGQTFTNLPFATAPEEPYAFSLLTLGPGSPTVPDTMYVADNKRGAVVKYHLTGGSWVEQGSVVVPEVTGVTANDVNGAVTIYASSAAQNEAGGDGTLYRISDVSGVNGTLSGIPVEIAKAPVSEAFRGVAFAPGTTIGHGGTPPAAPTISAAETALPAALGDPTNRSLAINVEGAGYLPSELTVRAESSNELVAPVSGITITGSGAERTVSVTPAAVGISELTLTVEAPNGAFSSTQVRYGASENEGDSSDRYYSGAGDAGSSIEVGGGYMIVAGDGSNVLNLYKQRTSGPPVKTYNFNSLLPYGAKEVNIHSSARAGNTIYWVGSFDNTNGGVVEPSHDMIFAATITGSGANTELTYLGSYDGLKEDMVEWDNANGGPLGLAASTAAGQAGEAPGGFKVQGVEFAPGSSTEAYLTFRAPLEPPGEGAGSRNLALVIPVTNFSSLVTDGNPGTAVHATFGTPLEWNLGGLTIRQIRKNEQGEYLIIASTANSSDTIYQLWGWDGEPEDEPVLLNASIPLVAEGVWDSITATPEPITNGSTAELLQDDSKSYWYGAPAKDAEKGLTVGLQKQIGRLVGVEIPAPGAPAAPHLSQGASPNKGQFTLRWKPAGTLRARFTLQHKNALGVWKTVATGLSGREYTFAAGNPEEEGTWNYRVSETNETSTSAYSPESEAVKVDQSAPYAPSAIATRAPDYPGKGGWYKNTVEVGFAANGDPALADGSAGSGVNAATLSHSQTFSTSGSHTACGTVADNVGNLSGEGCLTVQVDATPPSLEVSCPATALTGSTVSATVTASDGYSGLRSDPTGSVPIDTSTPGPQTTSSTAVSNVGLESTRSCTTEVESSTPGVPGLASGASPNRTGLFGLSWSGPSPLQYLGLTYTLQHRSSAPGAEWKTVAAGLETLSFAFSGAGEEEGTWSYRVQDSDLAVGLISEWSAPFEAVKVDRTAPYAPTATPTRSPDYAGGGGWYKNSVEVSFSANGDPALSDTSAGSGVDPATLSPTQTISTSGSHDVCGTVADRVGNVSDPGCVTVQVDATPPSLEISCPASALIGEAGVHATFKASEGYSGLSTPATGTVAIDTAQAGEKTASTTAISNAGLETSRSCNTDVRYPIPGAPSITVGATPNRDGRFTLGWTGASPFEYPTLGYTLQHRDSAPGAAWSTVATVFESLSFAFGGAGEKEGTWTYRVQATDPTHGETTEFSPASEPVKVDRTAPYAPTATPTRSPDYAGGGGWYKNSVDVSFTANGDPPLSDGSAGSGVDSSTLTATKTLTQSGSDEACGTVADNAGNVSADGCVTVQVDGTPPSLEISCPATALIGEAGVQANVTASDAYSGLKTDPTGTVAIDTSKAGEQTITRTAVSNVGLETTRSCTTEVKYTTPGAPALTSGVTPNGNGLFTLSWSGVNPAQHPGLTYALQHRSSAPGAEWTTVMSGLTGLSASFTGAGEKEGTWVYRVQGSDPSHKETTEFSPASEPVKVDRTGPSAPSASASRAPDYAGGGGWYKDSVTISFTANGDPALTDGSAGSGVDLATLSPPVLLGTSGSDEACGTVSDNVGNVSAPGCLRVQVDATPPSLEISCPAIVSIGQQAFGTAVASDAQSGLAVDPSGSIPINTSQAGPVTITRTAIDHVGHETTRSCTTQVGYTRILTGVIPGKLVIHSGESVELTSTAVAELTVTVERGGALDLEGATVDGNLKGNGASLLRACGATLKGAVKLTATSASVVLGDPAHGCAPDTLIRGATLTSNQGGVTLSGDQIESSLKVTHNQGATTVTNNKIAGSLTVTGNTGTVIDTPNEVKGKVKLQ
jgi:hypothetical protein